MFRQEPESVLSPEEVIRIRDFLNPPTDMDRRACSRIVPMKILCLGQSRTSAQSLRAALFELGYSDIYHMTSVFRQNPRDTEMWIKAFDAKYKGKGKPFGNAEWDALLGHCMVSFPAVSKDCMAERAYRMGIRVLVMEIRAATDHIDLLERKAAIDSPVNSFSEELLAQYLDAKLILTLRDSVDVWYKSYYDTIWPVVLEHHLSWWRHLILPKLFFWDFLDSVYENSYWHDFPRLGKQAYLEENEKARNLVPKEKLLE